MRMRIVFAIIFSVWVLLLVRIYYLSIKSNEFYEEIAEQNIVKKQFMPPARGLILDIKGRPLAVNRLGFSVSVKPHLGKKDVLDQELENLQNMFQDLNVTKLKKDYIKADSPYNQDFIEIIDFIDYDRMIPKIAALSLRENLEVKPASKRHYPYSNLASHIIGYVGRANQQDYINDPVTKITNYTGRSGIERYYNSILQGQEGVRKIKVNALNEEIEEIFKEEPKSSDIRLSIDLEFQKYIEEIFGENAGAIIVMDVTDGSIIAAGSFPEYDLNPFVTGISQARWNELINSIDHPFTNKLVNGLYPPGSVIKMGVALAFLDSGKIDRGTDYFCSGSFELGGRNFRCWNIYGHGKMDMNSAIRESCDDYFYKGSLKIGIDAIAPVLERFGMGQKTGVDLPNEFVGIVPSREWKMHKYSQPWYQGETLNTSIGQGNFLVTPMQIARHTAMLATGKNIIPHFLHSIGKEEAKFEASDIFTPFEKKQLPYIRKAMYEVVNHQKGTAFKYFTDANLTIAAKTGTAQVVGISQAEKKRIKEEDMKYLQRSHAWITTYAPYEKPKYVVTIIIEHGGHGGLTAGPMAVRVYNKLIELGYIDKKYAKNEQAIKKDKK
ncbi:penicillin-binding protein 2 [Campylobacter sp. RM16187]|uniref:penicillin-binding protein 2 n=1 Tax=Campylobacter sp. RM16187 TaxID=1660063 RepID=UPI0021B54467|nr:penicillin-binding protein 2 [Campylobacter sp. RM16187]QKG28966.1 penicillin-binding protein 2 [Campylobacter sp. RM16187]